MPLYFQFPGKYFDAVNQKTREILLPQMELTTYIPASFFKQYTRRKASYIATVRDFGPDSNIFVSAIRQAMRQLSQLYPDFTYEEFTDKIPVAKDS